MNCDNSLTCIAFVLKFGDQNTEHHWPHDSADMNSIDSSLWAQDLAQDATHGQDRYNTVTIKELQVIVKDFTTNYKVDKLKRMA